MKGPIARGTVRTTFVLGLRLVVQAGTLLIVARLLGPQHFGAFAGAVSLAVIIGTLSTFGTHLVLLGRVSRAPAERESVLAYALPTTIFCGSLLLVIYVVITLLALGQAAVALHVLVPIGVAEILLQPLFVLPVNEHLALGRIARSQLLTLLPLALRLAVAVAVAASLLSAVDPLTAYAYGYIGASVISLMLASATMPGRWPPVRVWRLPSKRELQEAAGYAALGLTATSPAELDKTLAAKLLPLGSAGVYSVGARVIGAATLPIIAMLLSALPRLFREGQTQPKRTSKLLHWIFGAALVYSIALTGMLWVIAPQINFLFGAKYHELDIMIRWLCFAVPGMALRIAAGSVLMTLDRPWMRAGFEVGGMTTLAIASILLTAKLGPSGMPLALACSEWLMAAVGLALLVHCSNDSPARLHGGSKALTAPPEHISTGSEQSSPRRQGPESHASD